MAALSLLPEEIQCPNCGVALKLNAQERMQRQFACSACRESFTVSLDAKYCPECGAEYRPEIAECSDCKVPLVDTLPQEDLRSHEADKYVEVMASYNVADLAVIKSVLDSEGIAYYLHGENFHAMTPWIQPVKIFVREEQLETARELLFELNLHATAVSLTTEQKDDDGAGGKE